MVTNNTAENYNDSSDFDETVEQAGRRATEVGKRISAAVSNTAHEIQEVGKEAIDEISKRSNVQLQKVEKFVRDEPLTSVAIAAGVGVLLGALLRR